MLPTTKHPKILEMTLDPKLTFSQHTNVTITKPKQTLNILKALTSTKSGKQEINCLYIQRYHTPHFGICKHHMEPYRIKHQHQETATHFEHCCANCYWLQTRYNTHTTKPRSFQWTPILNFMLLNLHN